ncbi:restriction endonuclease [Luteimonas gilva]|uniref:Restriction endonuclease n=1 Tax=Luteimonas gilva TaxID=2572684 RepID=A0A4U5JLX1_9GAMM|nr:BglII/BstYI family type II restriction endonuclease [Luteimonas gilva]TKR30622.1 restriction endonuclease [Luteimonas gilva]
MFEQLRSKGFEIVFLSHAQAILEIDFPIAVKELESKLLEFEIPVQEIIGSGGGESKGTQRLRRSLAVEGWKKTNFEIKKTINGTDRGSTSHEVDHVRTLEKGVIALELEWNNKDPFFDRDLENFKRLHAEGAISVGAIVTRGQELQIKLLELVTQYGRDQEISSFEDLARLNIERTTRQRQAIDSRVKRKRNPLSFVDAWASAFISDKYGQATTHWRKLEDRVQRGVGHPCPLLLIGLPPSIVTFPAGLSIDDAAKDVIQPEDNAE